jgi:hypothetical protein
MRTALEAFANPANELPINTATKTVVEAFNGVNVYVALATLFQSWLVLCRLFEIDAGTEFERLIATYEARTMATHRSSASVH